MTRGAVLLVSTIMITLLSHAARIRPPTQLRVEVGDFAVYIPVKSSKLSYEWPGRPCAPIMSNSGNLTKDANVVHGSLHQALQYTMNSDSKDRRGVGNDLLHCVSVSGIHKALRSLQSPLFVSERRRDDVLDRKSRFALELCVNADGRARGCAGTRLADQAREGSDETKAYSSTGEDSTVDSSAAFSLASQGSELDPRSAALADLLLGGAKTVEVTHGGDGIGADSVDETSLGVTPQEMQAAARAAESIRPGTSRDVDLREHFDEAGGPDTLSGVDGASAGMSHSGQQPNPSETESMSRVTTAHSMPAWALDQRYQPRYIGSGEITVGAFVGQAGIAMVVAASHMQRGAFRDAEQQLAVAASHDTQMPVLLHNVAIATTLRMLKEMVQTLKAAETAAKQAKTGLSYKQSKDLPKATLHPTIGPLYYGLLQYIKYLLVNSANDASRARKGANHRHFIIGNEEHTRCMAYQEAESSYAVGWVLELSGFGYEAADWYGRAVDAAGAYFPHLTERAFARLQATSPEIVPIIAMGAGIGHPSYLQVIEDTRRDSKASAEALSTRGSVRSGSSKALDFVLRVVGSRGPAGLRLTPPVQPALLDPYQASSIGGAPSDGARTIQLVEQAREAISSRLNKPFVLDIGGGQGSSSIIGAKRGANVVALEPIPHIHRLLYATAQLNGLATTSFGAGESNRAKDGDRHGYDDFVASKCELAAGGIAESDAFARRSHSDAVQRAGWLIRQYPAAAMQLRWLVALSKSIAAYYNARRGGNGVSSEAKQSTGALLAILADSADAVRGGPIGSEAVGQLAVCAVAARLERTYGWNKLAGIASRFADTVIQDPVLGPAKMSDHHSASFDSMRRFQAVAQGVPPLRGGRTHWGAELEARSHAVSSWSHLVAVTIGSGGSIQSKCPALSSGSAGMEPLIALVTFVASQDGTFLSPLPPVAAVERYPADLHDTAAQQAWDNGLCPAGACNDPDASSQSDFGRSVYYSEAVDVVFWYASLLRNQEIHALLGAGAYDWMVARQVQATFTHRYRMKTLLHSLQALNVDFTAESKSNLQRHAASAIARQCYLALSRPAACGPSYGSVDAIPAAAGPPSAMWAAVRVLGADEDTEGHKHTSTQDSGSGAAVSHHVACRPSWNDVPALAAEQLNFSSEATLETLMASRRTSEIWPSTVAQQSASSADGSASLVIDPFDAAARSLQAVPGCQRLEHKRFGCVRCSHVVGLDARPAGYPPRGAHASQLGHDLTNSQLGLSSKNEPSALYTQATGYHKALVDSPQLGVADLLRFRWYGQSAAAMVAAGYYGDDYNYLRDSSSSADAPASVAAISDAIASQPRPSLPDFVRLDVEGCEITALSGYWWTIIADAASGSEGVAVGGTRAAYNTATAARNFLRAVEEQAAALGMPGAVAADQLENSSTVVPSSAGAARDPHAVLAASIRQIVTSGVVDSTGSSSDDSDSSSRAPLPRLNSTIDLAAGRMEVLGAMGLGLGEPLEASHGIGSSDSFPSQEKAEALRRDGLINGTNFMVKVCPRLWQQCNQPELANGIRSPSYDVLQQARDTWNSLVKLGYMVVAIDTEADSPGMQRLPHRISQALLRLEHRDVGNIAVLVPPVGAGSYTWAADQQGKSTAASNLDEPGQNLEGLMQIFDSLAFAATIEYPQEFCLDLWMIPADQATDYTAVVAGALQKQVRALYPA